MNDTDRLRAAHAQLFHDVFFIDTRGKEILTMLERRFAKPAVTTGGIDAILQTYQRLGHREVLDHIHAQIERALSPPAENPLAQTGDQE